MNNKTKYYKYKCLLNKLFLQYGGLYKRILLIEDNENILWHLHHFLTTNYTCIVDVASKPNHINDVMRNNVFDLIISDTIIINETDTLIINNRYDIPSIDVNNQATPVILLESSITESTHFDNDTNTFFGIREKYYYDATKDAKYNKKIIMESDLYTFIEYYCKKKVIEEYISSNKFF